MLYSFQSLAWLNFLSSACRVQLRQTKLGCSILQYYFYTEIYFGNKNTNDNFQLNSFLSLVFPDVRLSDFFFCHHFSLVYNTQTI